MTNGFPRDISEDPIHNPQYYKQSFIIDIDELGFDVSANKLFAQEILNGVIDWVFQYTGLDTQYERREYLDGTGNKQLMVGHYPCQQLLDIQVNANVQDWIDITPYVVLLEQGTLFLSPTYFTFCFPMGDKNIRVRYIAGLVRIPPLIRMTIIELAQLLFIKHGIIGALALAENPAIAASNAAQAALSTDSTKGIKQVTIKSLSVTFADDKRTFSEMLQRGDVRKGAILALMDDLLKEHNSLLARLNMISKVYC